MVDLDPTLKCQKYQFFFIFDGAKMHEISRNQEI